MCMVIEYLTHIYGISCKKKNVSILFYEKKVSIFSAQEYDD